MSHRKRSSPIHRRAVLRGALATAAAGLTLGHMPGTGRASGQTGEQASTGTPAPQDRHSRGRRRTRVIWIGHL